LILKLKRRSEKRKQNTYLLNFTFNNKANEIPLLNKNTEYSIHTISTKIWNQQDDLKDRKGV